jgi:hypothetical protein
MQLSHSVQLIKEIDMTTQRSLSDKFGRIGIRRGTIFVMIILLALLAFEIFNYSTTDYALSDMLGNLRFAGVRWSTILAIAFCGIDFAGIARLFTPDPSGKETSEVWYLFGAWILAATMNAILTWWGVSMALLNHQMTSTAVMDMATLTKAVPIFVAVMVWLIRILIIGTLSLAGDKIAARSEQRLSSSYSTGRAISPTLSPSSSLPSLRPVSTPTPTPTPSLRPLSASPMTSTPSSRNASFQPFQRPAIRQDPGGARQDLSGARSTAAGRNAEPVYTHLDADSAAAAPQTSGRPEPVYQPLMAAPTQPPSAKF